MSGCRSICKRTLQFAAFAVLLGLCLVPLASAAGFSREKLPIERGRLFDLGVADYNNDGNLDVFSTNHKFLGSLLKGDGSGWTDVLGQSDLSATPEFPGWEDLLHPPVINQPGLYFYVESRTSTGGDGSNAEEDPLFHVVARNTGSIPGLEERASGKITLLSPLIRVKQSNGGIIHVEKDESANPPRTVVNFSVGENAHLVFAAKKVDLPPIEVSIHQAPAAATTYVGADKVPATDDSFRLFLRDRHGYAWGDYNSDGRIDAAIVRGGLGGAIKSFNGVLNDELMIANPSNPRFTDRIENSGFKKGACRSRHTDAVDYNSDGKLDVFITCKEGTPKLYQGFGNGRFQGISGKLRRAKAKGTAFRWVNVDRARGEELLAATKRRVKVYKWTGKKFKRLQTLRTRNSNSKVETIISTDFDRDGDADVVIATPSRNTVLVNRRGRLHAVSPFRFGLPGRSYTAAFTDYDNDGLIDIHFLPQGIYKQGGKGRFRATGREKSSNKAVWALLTWFDYDNDGARDYVRAINRNNKVNVQTGLFRNELKRNNWLEVDLVGKGGNRQAIGAKVTVNVRGRSQTQWVGDSDSSRFSRGHYRLYFGAGKAKRVKSVKVVWPLGSKTTLRKVQSDQRLVIRR